MSIEEHRPSSINLDKTEGDKQERTVQRHRQHWENEKEERLAIHKLKKQNTQQITSTYPIKKR